MMRSKIYWNDPDIFNPERFLKDGIYYVPSDAFIPFGIGTRKCVGEQFALSVLFIILIRIIQKTKDFILEIKTNVQDELLPDKNCFIELSPNKYNIYLRKKFW